MHVSGRYFSFSLLLVCIAVNSSFKPSYAQVDQAAFESSNLLSVEGVLSEGDATLQDGSLYDVYPFEGEAGQVIKIELKSDEFDTYLIVVDENGQTIGENDDSNGETNSNLTIELPRSSTYQIIANSYNASGRGQYFLEIYPATEIDVVRAEAEHLNQAGISSYNAASYHEALELFEQALNLQREIGDRAGEGATLNNIGLTYTGLSQYSQALDFSQQALDIRREIGYRPGESTTLNNIGLTYARLGQYEQAVDFYQQALIISQEIGDRVGEGTTLTNIGVAYDNLGQYSQALDFHQQALAIHQQIGDRMGEGTTLSNIGVVYSHLSQYPQSLDYYQQALAIRQEIGDRAGEGATLTNIGVVYLSLGEYSQALDFSQQALAIQREIGDRASEGTTLGNIGATFHQTAQYVEAENALYQALTVLESLREGDLEDTDKIALFDTQLSAYETLQQVLIAQDKTEAALEVAERGRARILVESLALGLSENVAQTIIRDAPDLEEIRRIAQEQDATLVSYSIIDTDVNTPELYIWVIRPDGTLIFRSVGLENRDLGQVVVQARVAVRGHNRGRSANNDDVTRDPSPQSSPAVIRASRHRYLQTLHQLLINPIADLLPTDPESRVVFVPHGELFLVPFPALMDADGTYLIEQHTILMAPSIQVLDLTRQQQERITTEQATSLALVVGNPTMPQVYIPSQDDYQTLTSLPGAEQEATEIAQILATQPILGQAATEADLKQQMGLARFIHLATHGLLEYGNPQAFGIRDLPGAMALAPGGGEDGLLTSSEILNLDLSAELVVLSACDTGLGEITGDGIIGLSRSFIVAGVPSVIVSLWAVPDAQTATLMTTFYQNLQQGYDKAQALRQAMLTLLQDPTTTPGDWAAFTLIGEAE